jgi:hypothetical protein
MFTIRTQLRQDVLPEIEVFVLGPPHDLDALNDPDPPKEQILLTGYVDIGRVT